MGTSRTSSGSTTALFSIGGDEKYFMILRCKRMHMQARACTAPELCVHARVEVRFWGLEPNIGHPSNTILKNGRALIADPVRSARSFFPFPIFGTRSRPIEGDQKIFLDPQKIFLDPQSSSDDHPMAPQPEVLIPDAIGSMCGLIGDHRGSSGKKIF